MFFELHKFAMCNRCPVAEDLNAILLSEDYKVYHSVGVLQGSANSAFAGRIALELTIILRGTLFGAAANWTMLCQPQANQHWMRHNCSPSWR